MLSLVLCQDALHCMVFAVYVFGPLAAPFSFTDTWTRIPFNFYVYRLFFGTFFFDTRASDPNHPIPIIIRQPRTRLCPSFFFIFCV